MKVDAIKFSVDNESISENLFYPDKPNGLGVIFIHGWGSSQKGYVERAGTVVKLGYYCLTFDLRGFGESEGEVSKLSLADHLDDVLAFYDFFKKNTKANKICVCGTSYGGYLAARLLEQRAVYSIIMRAPGIYKDEIFKKTKWRQEKQLLEEINKFRGGGDFDNSAAIKNIKKFDGYLLVVGSEKDKIIPKRVVKAYYDSAIRVKKREIVWVKGADHALSSSKSQREYIKILSSWFKKLPK